jgi:hypothetical protein
VPQNPLDPLEESLPADSGIEEMAERLIEESDGHAAWCRRFPSSSRVRAGGRADH